MRRLLRATGGTAGVLLVALVTGAALFAPWVATHDPEALDVLARFSPPSAEHWFGTDQVGRDLYSRVVYGSRVAMAVSLSAIALALVVGVPLGVLAAWRGGWTDRAVLGVLDVVASFPSLVLALAVVAVFGPGTGMTVLIVAATLVPQFARVARAQVLGVLSAPFIEAAQALGAGTPRLLLRHVMPNVLGPLIVLASMDIPVVVTIEAGLSFIGLGVQPPAASWGTLISDGYGYLSESAWPVLTASAALAVATLGFTLLGEALRDAADPRRNS